MSVNLLTAPFGVSKLNRRLQRLVRVYTCQNVKLLEISCGPNANLKYFRLHKPNCINSVVLLILKVKGFTKIIYSDEGIVNTKLYAHFRSAGLSSPKNYCRHFVC